MEVEKASDPLEELREITKNLSDISIASEQRLMWENVIIEKGLMSRGSEFRDAKRFGLHEYYHVIEGKLTIRLTQQAVNKHLLSGGHIHILPDEAYFVFAPRDTKYIYIAFPPNGGNNVTKV